MDRYLPDFIYDKYIADDLCGCIDAICLFIDIAGFTEFTERLMPKGKDGAEVLSRIVNNFMEPLIDIVHKWGGFISHFAGDAFFGLFPLDNSSDPYSASFEMIDTMKKHKFQKTGYGEFEISGRIGLSYGEISYHILGKPNERIYFFQGQALNDSVNILKYAKKYEVLLDKDLHDHLEKDNLQTIKKNDKCYSLLDIKSKISPFNERIRQFRKSIIEEFIPWEILSLNSLGEFRNITSIFLEIDELKPSIVTDIHGITKRYGKHLFHIISGDKGNFIFLVFGAPITYENNDHRALDLVLDIACNISAGFRAGITSGQAFAGIIGGKSYSNYDVLGNTVNLCARIADKAEWGQILIPGNLADKVKNDYRLEYLGKKQYKGFRKVIDIHRLIDKRIYSMNFVFTDKIIGRKKEISNAFDFIDQIINKGSSGLINIYGNPGIGKTRLAYELVNIFSDKSITLFMKTDNIIRQSLNPFIYLFNQYFMQYMGNNHKERMDIFNRIYDNLIQILKDNSADYSESEIISKELKEAKSFISSLLGLYWKNSLYYSVEPRSRHEYIFKGIKTFFKALSRIKPLIIVLEDAHWLDEISKKALNNFLSDISAYPIIFIITSRYNDDMTKTKIAEHKDIKTLEIDLEPLMSSDIERFIEIQLESNADNDLKDFIKERTVGNPFFIEQFCRFLKDNRYIEKQKDKYYLIAEASDIPLSINQILIARIDRLSPDLKKTVQIASVLGREFDINLLKNLLVSIDVDLSSRLMKELIITGKQEQIWSPLSEKRYIFKHALLHEGVYNMQMKTDLKHIHNIIAKIIESSEEEVPIKNYEIAYHYHMAEVLDKAVHYYRQTLDQLLADYNNTKAMEVADRLIDLSDDDNELIDLIIKKAQLLWIFARWDEALELLYNTLSLFPSGKMDLRRYIIKNNIANIFRHKSEYQKSIEMAESVINDLKDHNDKKSANIYANAVSILGNNYHCMSDFNKAMEYYNEEQSIYEKNADQENLAKVLISTGYIYSQQGDYEKALIKFRKSEEICKKLNLKDLLGKLLVNIGGVFFVKGDFDNAMEIFHQSIEILKQLGNKRELGVAISNMGGIYYHKGNYKKALECFNHYRSISQELGDKMGLCSALSNCSFIHQESGDFENALKLLFQAEKICIESENLSELINIYSNLGNSHKQLKNYKRAMDYLKKGYDIAVRIGSKYGRMLLIGHIGEIHFEEKEYDLSAKCLKEMQMLYEETHNDVFLFNIRLLENKLKYLSQGEEPLLSMLNELKDPNQILEIYYTLSKISENKKYIRKTMEICNNLMSKSPLYRYRKIIEELNCLLD